MDFLSSLHPEVARFPNFTRECSWRHQYLRRRHFLTVQVMSKLFISQNASMDPFLDLIKRLGSSIPRNYAESSTVSHRYWPITIQISIDKINVETKQLMFQIFKYPLTYPLAGLNTDAKYECSWLPNSSDSGFGDIFIVNFQLCHTWERAVVRARIQSRSRLKCWCIVLLDTLLLSPFQS